MRLEKRRKNSKFWPEGCQNGWRQIRGRGGGTSGPLIPEVRGTRGSLPEGTSQPDDPDGVGGLKTEFSKTGLFHVFLFAPFFVVNHVFDK